MMNSKRKVWMWLLAPLALTVAAAASCTLPLPGVLDGTVRDGAGSPKPGMTVAVYATNSSSPVQTATTGIDGSYSFTLPGANYRLGVTDPMHGFYDYWQGGTSLDSASRIAVSGGEVDIDVTMSPVITGLAPYTGTGHTVAMAGDSITFWSTSTINQKLSSQFRYSVTGVNGYDTLTAKWIVDGYVTTSPDAFIMDLGTNDISRIVRGVSGYTIADYKARTLAYAAQFRCFVPATITTHITTATSPWAPQADVAAQEMNDWLHATFTNVVEWDAAVAASPTPITYDEVHPNHDGQVILADLVSAAASRCTTT